MPRFFGVGSSPSPSPKYLLQAIVDSSDDAIISQDLQGIITSWNRGAERIFGYTQEEIIGRPIHLLLPESRRTEEDHFLRAVGRGDRIDHYETTRRRKDGQLIDVSITISPIRDDQGAIVGASKISRDITESRRFAQANWLLAAIVNSSEDAIVSKNLQGIITSWNTGARRLFGYEAHEIIGQPVLKLIPSDRQDEELSILDRLHAGERIEHLETVRVKKNGAHIPVWLTISPIRNAKGEIVGASKIARDISDLKRFAAEREHLLESEREARRLAEAANRMKDEFLSTVSHELRTPLNAIMGWTEVLADGGRDIAEIREGIEVIKRNVLVQAQIIEDLLDLGRIVSGKMILNVESADVGAIVNDAITSVRHAATMKEITVKPVIHDTKGSLMGDSKRLQQVVWNLLSNAIKFTPRGGRVMVTVIRVNSHIEISVIDNGAGIPPEFLPRVFDRFSQADSSTTRSTGGLGIGLALVKQLVEMHAGTVRAESGGVGKGAKFTVSLPIVATQAHPEMPTEEPSSESSPSLPLADLSRIKVLAVDDDHDSLNVLKRILQGRNASVKAVSSADEALTEFESFAPNVIISDIGMPGTDGFDLIRRIRALPAGKSIPAIALTALARSIDRTKALTVGFQTHVAKPVAAAEIIAVVRSMADLHR